MAEVTGGGKLSEALVHLRDRILSAREVRVGFLEGATYSDGDLNVPTVAAINNFGAPGAGIPARPFFSDMVLRCSPDWGEKFAAVLKSTDYDVKAALELMGIGMSDQLRTEIIDFDSVPNSPVTDLLKERFPTGVGVQFGDVQQARIDVANGEVAAPGKPLVWSGQMLSSVDSEVE